MTMMFGQADIPGLEATAAVSRSSVIFGCGSRSRTKRALRPRQVAQSISACLGCGVSKKSTEKGHRMVMLRSYPVSITELAQRAEVTYAEAFAAALGPLAAAITTTGLIELGHPVVLAYFAARPFGPEGAPRIDGDGYLVPATGMTPQGVGTDVTHPIAWSYLARTWGRVPTQADFDVQVSASRWVSNADLVR